MTKSKPAPNSAQRLIAVIGWLEANESRIRPEGDPGLWCELKFGRNFAGTEPVAVSSLEAEPGRVQITNLQQGDVDALSASCNALGFSYYFDYDPTKLVRCPKCDTDVWLRQSDGKTLICVCGHFFTLDQALAGKPKRDLTENERDQKPVESESSLSKLSGGNQGVRGGGSHG